MIESVALLCNFGVGIVLSIIGALKIELTGILDIDDARAGGLVSAMMSTSLLMILILGPLVDLFGHKPIAVAGLLIGSSAVFLLVSADSYKMALAACIILGIGGMCLNSVGNTLLPLVLFEGKNATAAMNLGTVFFVLGASVTPFVIGLLLKSIGYKGSGYLIACLLLLPVFFAAYAVYPKVPVELAYQDLLALMTDRLVFCAGLVLFCYVGTEMSMGAWITTYLKAQRFSNRAASMTLSSFWLILIVPRLIASTFVTPQIGLKIIFFLGLMSSASIGLMMISKSKTLAVGAVLLTGFSFGPIFPTTVGVVFSKIPESLHGSTFSIIFGMALLGGSTIPAAVGITSKKYGIRKAFSFALSATLVLCVVVFSMRFI